MQAFSAVRHGDELEAATLVRFARVAAANRLAESKAVEALWAIPVEPPLPLRLLEAPETVAPWELEIGKAVVVRDAHGVYPVTL